MTIGGRFLWFHTYKEANQVVDALANYAPIVEDRVYIIEVVPSLVDVKFIVSPKAFSGLGANLIFSPKKEAKRKRKYLKPQVKAYLYDFYKVSAFLTLPKPYLCGLCYFTFVFPSYLFCQG